MFIAYVAAAIVIGLALDWALFDRFVAILRQSTDRSDPTYRDLMFPRLGATALGAALVGIASFHQPPNLALLLGGCALFVAANLYAVAVALGLSGRPRVTRRFGEGAKRDATCRVRANAPNPLHAGGGGSAEAAGDAMPVEPIYPGVYVEELPSGQHTITGVPTSIAAFVGRASFGPVGQPLKIFNFGDFTRWFGGLQVDCPLGYAVQDFFDNGGSEAIVVRLFEPNATGDGIARLAFPGEPAGLRAASSGNWGNRLEALVDRTGITGETAAQFARFGIEAADLFNLTLTLSDEDGRTLATERYLNLSVRADGEAGAFPNRLDGILRGQSVLAAVDLLPPAPPPAGASATGTGGDDGGFLSAATYVGDPNAHTGIHALELTDIFNLLCIPPDRRISGDVPEAEQDLPAAVLDAAARYCTGRSAILIVDPPARWKNLAGGGGSAGIEVSDIGIDLTDAGRNAAVYFPRLWRADPLAGGNQALFVPCGAVAGVIARTDVQRGLWKAPAGTDATLVGVSGFEVRLTDEQNGALNPLGINCLRSFPVIGNVVWGARTLRGDDAWQDDYKYLTVRRLALFVEQSILRGTRWAVFEPNDETLWSSLRLAASTFLEDLKRQGAFYNYHVQCDATTTTASDIDRGIVNLLVMLAPVDPAEFVVLQIQQQAGQGN